MQHINRVKAAISLMPAALIMVASLLLGWGIGDLREFFLSPARAAVIAIVVCDFMAGTILGIEMNPFRKGNRSAKRWPIVAGMFTTLPIFAAASYCDRRGLFVFADAAVIRWIGVAAFATGSAIRLAALYELGRQYSAFLTIQSGHQLIRSGVYARIRHPFYLGGLLNLPGVLLAFRSPIAVVIFVASMIFVINRIGREERLLSDEFPGSYREYQEVSWRLVPHVF